MKFKLLILCLLFPSLYAQEAPSWIDYTINRKNNTMDKSILLDFSFAGYHFSEKEIPNVSEWNQISVADYGALPDDANYDDAGIKAAITAAQNSNVPTVVYFPAGKYLVSDEANQNSPIIITKSNIVLKGAGSGSGGTEIYTNLSGNYPWRFQFKPVAMPTDKITGINKRIHRGDYKIEVLNASNLSVGQTVELYHQGIENLEVNMPGLTYNAEWNTGKRGVRTLEKHVIQKIEGNTITFKNPVKYTITADVSGAQLNTYNTINEVGVEDILFTSAWKEHPDIYAHHASDLVDYAWRALMFENVMNGWIRNCEFRDWNEDIMIEKCMSVTIKNVQITGKQGHTSYFARYSYGILFENCVDKVPTGFNDAGGQGHGPGMRWASTNTVFLNCGMQKHQSIDCHGYHPYGNLLDNVYGGAFRANGGAWNSYPNSGPDLTFWNFIHDSNYSSKTYDFWDPVNRKLNTFAYPKFIGFQSPGESISLQHTGLNELQNKNVYPNSLFDAQLQLRLYNGYMTASSSKTGNEPINANNPDSALFWSPSGDGIGEYLTLDLGTVEAINGIYFTDMNSNVNKFKLEQWNESEWVNIELNPNISNSDTIKFTHSIFSRKIRFTIDSLNKTQNPLPVQISKFGYVLDDNSLRPPVVQFTTRDTTISEGYKLSLEAQISNESFPIEKLELFINNNFLSARTEAPYIWGYENLEQDYELNNLSVGNHTIKVIATDIYGNISQDEIQLTIEVDLGSRIKACHISASTSLSGHNPQMAIDSIYNNSSYWSGAGKKATLTLDLCDKYLLKNVGVTWLYGDRWAYNFDIEVSTDNINWTSVFSGQSSGLTSESEIIPIVPTEGRYIRYIGNGNTASSLNAVIEIDIYGQLRSSTLWTKIPIPNFSVFPNPAKSQFSIHTNVSYPVDIHIYNVYGKLVYTVPQITNNQTIHTNNILKSGTYLLILSHQDGLKKTQKLILL